MNDGGHLVRCLGRERRIWRQAPDEEGWTFAIEGGLAGLNGRYRPPGDAVHWNLSGERPAWLPIAWLCCEADPGAGPGFASAILGAKPGNDVPALVACDWLEERGTMGLLGPGWRPDPGNILEWSFNAAPEGDSSPHPLHSWCRALIAARCPRCGDLRNGEDAIECARWASSQGPIEPVMYLRRSAPSCGLDFLCPPSVASAPSPSIPCHRPSRSPRC